MAGTTVGVMLVPQVILPSSIFVLFSSFAWFLRKEKKGRETFREFMYGVYKSRVNYGHWFPKEIDILFTLIVYIEFMLFLFPKATGLSSTKLDCRFTIN